MLREWEIVRKISCDYHGQRETDKSPFELRIARIDIVSPSVVYSGSNESAEELNRLADSKQKDSDSFLLFSYSQRPTLWITRSLGTALSSTYVRCSKKIEWQLLPVKNVSCTSPENRMYWQSLVSYRESSVFSGTCCRNNEPVGPGNAGSFMTLL